MSSQPYEFIQIQGTYNTWTAPQNYNRETKRTVMKEPADETSADTWDGSNPGPMYKGPVSRTRQN